jgi:hypothetical protein
MLQLLNDLGNNYSEEDVKSIFWNSGSRKLPPIRDFLVKSSTFGANFLKKKFERVLKN